ncbi:RNA methyltransferase [Aliiglaciecola sp. 3_MG-2023]|uniref:TrmH family RNA methyltransferase n=1 Tax=Aliiglaciecola sp. 3_MG-2023 TaxID=3062644 RepID=UPI0026E45410|nr:RNA methyltransferase [Aliiglaciecola sp. 3_MG-2023]MDO6694477.1 RNA methyltransferase [Aliiglaciecola sp. 3_MG-2023]
MKFDDVKKLHQKKYRSQFGYYLVEGEHLVLELQKALKTHTDAGDITLYVTEEYQGWASQLSMDCTIANLNKKQMAQLSDTKTPQGIIACVPLPKAVEAQARAVEAQAKAVEAQAKAVEVQTKTAELIQPSSQNERCIYLHEVQDPGNLGTILRTLAWFGGFRLLLSPNSVDPFNSKVVRASMGAIFHVPIELDVELEHLRTRFKGFAYLDMQGKQIQSSDFANYQCYLFGNEARGVPNDALSACDADAYTIVGSGKIDSLNLASAVNICVYQLSI